VNSALLPVHVAFLEAGVPIASPLGPAVLRRTGVRTALAYLRIAQDPERIRRTDVVDTVHRPSRKISRMVVEMMTKRSTTSIAGIRKLGGILTGSDAPKLMAYAQDLEKVANTRTTAEALRTVRLGLGLGAQMEALDGSHGETDRSTHTDDLLAIEAVAALHPQPLGFEEWLTELLERPGAQGPAVLLSTVHKIKGKEWPKVLALGANQGLFPHRRANDEEGERRVFHVALTRALEQAVILFDAEAPSPFIAELDGSRPHVPLQQKQDRPPEAGPSKKETRRGPSKPGAGESVVATVGLELEVGGQRGAVVELRPMGALVRVGAARMEVAYGTRVLVGDRVLALGAPSESAPSPAAKTIEAALREWRSATAKSEKVPAYVVMNDADLRGVAERAPASLAELGACHGIGPLRLERYGDEILAIVEEAGAAAG
jgi:DNA helicase-2/ATP-dependent DNA helicase PcrA